MENPHKNIVKIYEVGNDYIKMEMLNIDLDGVNESGFVIGWFVIGYWLICYWLVCYCYCNDKKLLLNRWYTSRDISSCRANMYARRVSSISCTCFNCSYLRCCCAGSTGCTLLALNARNSSGVAY